MQCSLVSISTYQFTLGIGAQEIMSKVWSDMTSDPFSIEFTSTLKDAVESMVKHGIGNLGVTDAASIGLLTERELSQNLEFFEEIPDRASRYNT